MKNSRQVIFEFESEDLLEDFLAYMSDGGGEQGWIYEEPYPDFDYKECFPAWGWNGKTTRKVKITRYEENKK